MYRLEAVQNGATSLERIASYRMTSSQTSPYVPGLSSRWMRQGPLPIDDLIKDQRPRALIQLEVTLSPQFAYSEGV